MNHSPAPTDIHLVIVDVQHDFAHPAGALFVPGAEQAVENIAQLLHDPRVTQLTFTLDWHPYDHSSFADQGGTWPRHCVQYSKGASLHESLWVENFDRFTTHFVRKGQQQACEEYGAFAAPTDEQREWLQQGRLVVCGIAGDYCVLKSSLPAWPPSTAAQHLTPIFPPTAFRSSLADHFPTPSPYVYFTIQ